MGHWVHLSPIGSLPEPLDTLPNQNFLRYYCDQRYALTIEDYLRDRLRVATLEVRLWRGTALAAGLLAEAKADPETLANTEACNHFIEAFAALVNARYAQTQDPRLAAYFDELLLYHSWRTCDALYNAVTTPEAYGQALDFIRAQQPPGALLPLGGGLNAKPNAKPARARARDFARLLSLAEELLTP